MKQLTLTIRATIDGDETWMEEGSLGDWKISKIRDCLHGLDFDIHDCDLVPTRKDDV